MGGMPQQRCATHATTAEKPEGPEISLSYTRECCNVPKPCQHLPQWGPPLNPTPSS
ncbi:hypothetical protein COCSUDRAFT_34072 [Coccomyxa subellipsoidea C-169]|uniref:Uncharacterized protein n=1 Tax=Coccomyxa subellipsoidea (strain C-169) TaxID=574566 RepID=I0YP92_COCSC|nr:hypothetical protein COCSUDRAFT_34072 [Coccomyxa subellipsoidea C-169]EIE20211.1 hypothetical protein COCSUDRAFT_34072 [Coccomyxa subellipsoidea C-169]|eukprot:XP_005644755.1 hypothetical protein COCSUDRAFT_34072 [Coccomyxa subellipsoidea C-169]